jgi:hypothetical protein
MEKIGKTIALVLFLIIAVAVLNYINANHPVPVAPPSHSLERTQQWES